MKLTHTGGNKATVTDKFEIELTVEELEQILAPITPSIPIPPPRCQRLNPIG
jgi:hypothetical protein